MGRESTNASRQPNTRLATASLVLGALSLVMFACLGIGPLVSVGLGVAALVKARRSPREYGGRGLAIAGILCSGTATAMWVSFLIALPALLGNDLVANEKAAIEDILAMRSAQLAYSEINGAYDTPACLAAPRNCLPGHEAKVQPFVDRNLLGDRAGYRRRFVPGLPVSPADIEDVGASPSSLLGFAYVAYPITRNRTGVRGFCADSTGRFCFTADGSEPATVDGACGSDCTDMPR